MGRVRLRDLMEQEKARRAAQRQAEGEQQEPLLKRARTGAVATPALPVAGEHPNDLPEGFFDVASPSAVGTPEEPPSSPGISATPRGILRLAQSRRSKEGARVTFQEDTPPVHVYEWEEGPSFENLPPAADSDESEEEVPSEGSCAGTGVVRLAELGPTLRMKLRQRQAGGGGITATGFNWVAAVAEAEGAKVVEEYQEIEFDAKALARSLADAREVEADQEEERKSPQRATAALGEESKPDFLDAFSVAEEAFKRAVTAAESQNIVSEPDEIENSGAVVEGGRLVIEAAPTGAAATLGRGAVDVEASFREFEEAIKTDEAKLRQSLSLKSQVKTRGQEFEDDLMGLSGDPLSDHVKRLEALKHQVQAAVSTASAIRRQSLLMAGQSVISAEPSPTTLGEVMTDSNKHPPPGDSEAVEDFDSLLGSEQWKWRLPAELGGGDVGATMSTVSTTMGEFGYDRGAA